MYIEAVAIVIGISQHKMYAVVLVNVVRERDRERERGREGGEEECGGLLCTMRALDSS